MQHDFSSLKGTEEYRQCGKEGVALLEEYAVTALLTPKIYEKLTSLDEAAFEQWLVDNMKTLNDVHRTPSSRAEAERVSQKMEHKLRGEIPREEREFRSSRKQRMEQWTEVRDETARKLNEKMSAADQSIASQNEVEELQRKVSLLDGWEGKFEPSVYGPYSRDEAESMFPPREPPSSSTCSAFFGGAVPESKLKLRSNPKKLFWMSTCVICPNL